MNFFATGLAGRGFRVARFEFPYMVAKRRTGKAKPPDREPILRETWLKASAKRRQNGLVTGGNRCYSIPAVRADDSKFRVARIEGHG
jgi:uncharacterized protein